MEPMGRVGTWVMAEGTSKVDEAKGMTRESIRRKEETGLDGAKRASRNGGS